MLAERDVLIGQLMARLAELEAVIGQNSQNSSRPPSSDSPFDKPAPKSLRKKTGRKPGGQAGHQGTTLEQVAVPDRVIRYEPAACDGCGHSLADATEVGVERRQEFDIPPVAVRVIEHRLISRRCACGTTSKGLAPAGVDAPVQYGPQITAIIVYLYVGQFLSKARTAKALAELFGTPISSGTVAAMTRRAAGGLAGFLELVRGALATAPVVHFDETGFRVAARLHWVHSASTGKYSLITVHPKRGTEAINAAGVLPDFTGVAVHDAWAPYDTYTSATHSLCCAHVLRELAAVEELTPTGEWCWARQAADALLDLKKRVDEAIAAGTTGIDPQALAEHTHRLRSAANIGAHTTRGRATTIVKKHHALARRLLHRQADYLRFATDFAVPSDNNAAEREIRMIKVRQKVSGGMRTLAGAEQFCSIRSYLATAAKHGVNYFTALVDLATGQPWTPATA